MQGSHWVAPGVELKVPATHLVHVVTAAPAERKKPAGHWVHALPEVAWPKPPAHRAHTDRELRAYPGAHWLHRPVLGEHTAHRGSAVQDVHAVAPAALKLPAAQG